MEKMIMQISTSEQEMTGLVHLSLFIIMEGCIVH